MTFLQALHFVTLLTRFTNAYPELMFYHNQTSMPMNLLDSLLHKLHLRKRRKTLARFDFQTRQAILELARQQNRPPAEVASQMMALGLEQYQLLQEKFQIWEQLTPRQKDVAALVCLGYTNQQIAERLKISSETVKVHVSNIFEKFHLHNRKQLAEMLKDWDFSAWRDRYDAP